MPYYTCPSSIILGMLSFLSFGVHCLTYSWRDVFSLAQLFFCWCNFFTGTFYLFGMCCNCLLQPGTKSGDLGLANYPSYLVERFEREKKEMDISKIEVTRICCEAE